MGDRGVLSVSLGNEAKEMLRDLADAKTDGSMTAYLDKSIRTAHGRLPEPAKKRVKPKSEPEASRQDATAGTERGAA